MNKIYISLLLFSVLATFNSVQAQKGSWANLYAPSTFKELPYRLMKPANFDKSKIYPLILSLHGAGGKGKDNKKQLKDWNGQLASEKIRKDYPCYVLAPHSPGLWNKEQFLIIKEIRYPEIFDKNRQRCKQNT